MKMLDLKTNSHKRIMLENKALAAICACYYYDLADALDATTNEELEKIISESSATCLNCTDESDHRS